MSKLEKKELVRANRALKKLQRDFGDSPEFIDWVLEDAYLAAKGKSGRIAAYSDKIDGEDVLVLYGNKKSVDEVHQKLVGGVPTVRGYYKRPSPEALEHILAPKFPALFEEQERVHPKITHVSDEEIDPGIGE